MLENSGTEPVAISPRWRWFSFLFGVLVPLGVWGFLASAMQPERGRVPDFIWTNVVFVVLQAATLSWHLFSRAPAPWAATALCIWLSAGGAYALAWAVLGMFGWSFVLENDDHPALAKLAGLVYLASPWPCVWIYFGNARLAGAAAKSGKP